MKVAGIVFSNLNENKHSCLTEDRTLAALPFACRYRLVDFALSNMVNAGISNISVITNYNYRSLLDHIGSGKDWDLARRRGGITLFSPFQSGTPVGKAGVYKTHLEALQSMRGTLGKMKEELIVMADCEYVFNPDLSSFLRIHRESGCDMTLLATRCRPFSGEGTNRLFLKADKEGRLTGATIGKKAPKGNPLLFTDAFIVSRSFLLRLLGEAERRGYTSLSRDFIVEGRDGCDIRVALYEGAVVSVGNFNDYFNESIRLTRDPLIREALFGNPLRPILTRIHNSSPVKYRGESCVRDSMIADDCVIEGRIENSVLFRGVKVGKGSTVTNCVLFENTEVKEGCTLHCVVSDKSVVIEDGRLLSGHSTMPIYIPKDRKV